MRLHIRRAYRCGPPGQDQGTVKKQFQISDFRSSVPWLKCVKRLVLPFISFSGSFESLGFDPHFRINPGDAKNPEKQVVRIHPNLLAFFKGFDLGRQEIPNAALFSRAAL
jgi:hypothetical protein